MSAAISDLELNSLTIFQTKIHFGSNDTEIGSYILSRDAKCTWQSTCPIKFQHTISGDTIRYITVPNFHFLAYSYRLQKLPQIKVKDEYKGVVKIQWPKNIANHIFKNARLIMDREIYQTLDSVGCDIFHQFSSRNSDQDIGVPDRDDWSDALDEKILTVEDPWFYNKDYSKSIHLYLKDIIHEYDIVSDVENLLKMKKMSGGVWETVRCDKSLLDYKPIPIPELWGRFGKMHEFEFKWNSDFHLQTPAHKLDYPDGQKIVYYDDIIDAPCGNPVKMDKKNPIQITVSLESKLPVKAVFFVMENMKDHDNNNFASYVCEDGKSPINTVSWHYATSPRFADMDFVHFEQVEPKRHTKSRPTVKGYGLHSLSYNINNAMDIGIVPLGEKNLNAKMTFKLRLMDDPTDYKLHVKMLVQRQLTYTKDKVSKNEN